MFLAVRTLVWIGDSSSFTDWPATLSLASWWDQINVKHKILWPFIAGLMHLQKESLFSNISHARMSKFPWREMRINYKFRCRYLYNSVCLFVCFGRDNPPPLQCAMATSFTRFLDHTQWCTTDSQQKYIHASGGVRTHNLSRRAAAGLLLRPHGDRDRLNNSVNP